MKYIKEHFLNYSIHKQIQLGIIGVSSCVGFLVILVLTLNVFILLNLSYIDIRKVMDSIENSQIDGEDILVDLQLTFFKDFSKNGIQYIRNVYDDYNRRSDVISSYTFINSSKYIRTYLPQGYPDCDTSYQQKFNCIMWKNFSINNLNENPNFASVYFSFPFFQIVGLKSGDGAI